MRLHCSNLVKKYGTRTVVKNVSIEVEQGEIVGLLGPNGAGKTTTFYMITGLINLTPEGFSLMKKRLLIFLCTKGLRKGWVIWLKRLLYLEK